MKQQGPHSDSPLVQWLKTKGFWVAADVKGVHAKRKRLTHVFLNGGKASVPEESWSEFDAQYARCVASGRSMYAVERPRTDGFKMFMDLDFKKVTQARDANTVMTVTRRILREMDALLRDEGVVDTSAIVCTKQQKKIKNGDSSSLYSDGVHVIWRAARVDSPKAILLRDACVQQCRRIKDANDDDTDDVTSVDVNEVIDSAVYRNNGLRMIMSLKRDAPTYYVPTFTYSGETKEFVTIPAEEVFGDLGEWVKACSVLDSAPSFNNGTGIGNGTVVSSSVTAAASVSAPAHPAIDIGGIGFGSEDVSETDLEEVRRHLPHPYDTCRFASARRFEDGTGYTIVTDSRFCGNLASKGGFHRSNRVYLVVDGRGVQQRCFCTCDTTRDRITGKCSEARVRVLDSANDVTVANLALVRRADERFREVVESKKRKREEEGDDEDLDLDLDNVPDRTTKPGEEGVVSAVGFWLNKLKANNDKRRQQTPAREHSKHEDKKNKKNKNRNRNRNRNTKKSK